MFDLELLKQIKPKKYFYLYFHRALQFPPDAWLRFTIHHCSITWIVITPTGRVIVRGLGDSGHIPSEAVTSN
mgnify:CR=1 FL=1